VLLAVISAPPLTCVFLALLPSFFRAASVRLPATMALLLSEMSAKAAPAAARDALRTSSATTVLTASTCTREAATQSALLVPSETNHQETGSALLAMLLARHASTTPHTALAASTDRDTFRPPQSPNLASSAVWKAPTLKAVSARSATSDAPHAWAQLATAFLALPIRSSTREDAGLNVPLFLSNKSVRMPHALTPAPVASGRFP
jgi:hypothetical protein